MLVGRRRAGAWQDAVMSERVSVSISGGVADVRLNRADKRNALDGKMFAAIAEAGESLKSTAGVRAVVLSGSGASFCAGLDFSAFQEMAGNSNGSEGATAGVSHIAEGRITLTFARPGKLLVHVSDGETFGQLRLDEPAPRAGSPTWASRPVGCGRNWRCR